jgi:hypothetical protein
MRDDNKSLPRKIPLWAKFLIDFFALGAALCVFALFHHVLPKDMSDSGTVITRPSDFPQFQLPSGNTDAPLSTEESFQTESPEETADVKEDNTETPAPTAEPTATPEPTILPGNRVTLSEYNGDEGVMKLEKVEIGNGENKVTYYVANVYVKNVSGIKAGLAEDKYGLNYRESVESIARRHNAIIAFTGDNYGSQSEDGNDKGVVIRNGVLYRNDPNIYDVCVLFSDGRMVTYSPEDFDAEEMIKKGAWQAWTFGPMLLDGQGNVLEKFNVRNYIRERHPRNAIGYVEPGHYVFVTVDGRDRGYSIGANITKLAEIMASEGCNTAYNLDGGASAIMYCGLDIDDIVNQPNRNGRDVSDVIYFGGN